MEVHLNNYPREDSHERALQRLHGIRGQLNIKPTSTEQELLEINSILLGNVSV